MTVSAPLTFSKKTKSCYWVLHKHSSGEHIDVVGRMEDYQHHFMCSVQTHSANESCTICTTLTLTGEKSFRQNMHRGRMTKHINMKNASYKMKYFWILTRWVIVSFYGMHGWVSTCYMAFEADSVLHVWTCAWWSTWSNWHTVCSPLSSHCTQHGCVH